MYHILHFSLCNVYLIFFSIYDRTYAEIYMNKYKPKNKHNIITPTHKRKKHTHTHTKNKHTAGVYTHNLTYINGTTHLQRRTVPLPVHHNSPVFGIGSSHPPHSIYLTHHISASLAAHPAGASEAGRGSDKISRTKPLISNPMGGREF